MKFLIIQTSFLGDVVFATGVAEKLHQHFPDAKIDMLIRKGNEGMIEEHPCLNKIILWEKKKNKYKNLFSIIGDVRKEKYDYVINLHRWFSTGLITVLSGAKHTRGFKINPLSVFFGKSVKHEIGTGKLEYERNHDLIRDITDEHWAKPKLYPSQKHFAATADYKQKPYVCIAPTTNWFTKQFPTEKWIQLINRINSSFNIYLIGAPNDFEFCEMLIKNSSHPSVINLAGKLSLLESAALMVDAKMNYSNDSAALHMCSALNAPIVGIYQSTAPILGFTPLSDVSFIAETKEILACRPCGFHGYKKCPQVHFKCSLIDVSEIPVP
jgi:ADP-heptose:LPS heptosyltransferase